MNIYLTVILSKKVRIQEIMQKPEKRNSTYILSEKLFETTINLGIQIKPIL